MLLRIVSVSYFRPFLAAKMCTVPKARMVIIVLSTIAALSRLSNFWENKVVQGM